VRTGAYLTLAKTLPVASGIGGGSADAAAALRLLGRLWGVAPAAEALRALALRLGADVPVCLAGRPARMGGVGEVLSPAPDLPAFGVVLVNAGVAVSTPEVFRARSGRFSAPAALPSGWPNAVVMARDLAALGNDLEPPAMALCPVIGEVLTALRTTQDCLLARMSGSGATCFGVFADAAGATAAAEVVRRPAWWVWGGAC
jgi:4-diphosphocytidyl-2-C-methyl-D-erythritol kinase